MTDRFMHSRLERGVPTHRVMYNIIMTVFTWGRDVCLPTKHSTDLLQKFTCVIADIDKREFVFLVIRL